MSLSVVLPCFNEQENIERSVSEALAWLDTKDIEGIVIVVDDGSRDDSPRILAEMAQEEERLSVVTHGTNQGYGLAVRSGCDAAETDWIAFVDSDGQFRFSDLDLLLPHIEEHSFVPGRRRKRADPFLRNVFGKVLGILVFLTFGLWVRDVNCGMKVFSRETWQKIRPVYGTEKFFNTELYLRLKRASIPWKQIDVPHYPRAGGTPTGASGRVIFNMFRELWDLRSKLNGE